MNVDQTRIAEYVSLVIPVYNEQANLAELIQRCVAVGRTLGSDFELVLVDDGSQDESARVIAKATDDHPGEVVGVLLNRNYGQHSAVMAGLSHASGQIIVTLDADLQNPPEEIPKLLAAIAAGHDVVGGIRQHRQDSRFRILASRLMNRLTQRLTGTLITDYGCMLRAYRRDIVDAVLACRDHSAYVPALANCFAGNPGEVVVEHRERRQGESKYRLTSLLSLYFDLLVSATTTPLRLLSIAGTLFAVGGFALGLLLLILRLILGPEWAAEGVMTLLAILFIFLGVQLFGMGLLGEYLGRISRDVQARPRYVVHRVVGERTPSGAGLTTTEF